MKRFPKDRTLAGQLSGAFRLFGRLVGGAFVVTAIAYGLGWAWFTPELERSRLAARTESTAHAAMLDQETGLRAYLATRDARFIEPYRHGEAVLDSAHQVLTTTVGSVPELAAAMLDTRLAEERWRAEWARAVVGVGNGDEVGISLVSGKTLFDAYRNAEATFAHALDERRDVLSMREARLTATRVGLELGVFIAVLLLAVRQHRALHEAIVSPVAALLGHIRRIRDGDLDATAERSGPRELAELAEGLNEMVGALTTARQTAASRDEAIRQHATQLRLILDASREFSESLNLAYVVGAVRDSTTTVGGYEQVIVWLMDEEQKRLTNADQNSVLTALEAPVEVGQGLAGRAGKAGRITFEDAAGKVRFGDSNTGPVAAIAIPLIVGGRVVGVLEARHDEAKPATTQVIEVLETLATHAATAIESARLHELIRERSHMDALTRLLNRRRLEEDLEAECLRCARYGRPLAFVMLDVDHFKAFNDAHGHPQGDTALQQVADVIAGCVRATDTAYRYGGEEFCVLLRETCADDAMLFAERIRQRIEHRFLSGAMAGITASLGVAGFLAEAPTPRALVEAADTAMYESKHAGRNRATLSTPTPPPDHDASAARAARA